MPVEADHVYLIPPKKEMIISGGRLLLSERDRQQERTLPIDVFFRSLAQDCGPRAVAIVLSGGGSDGSRGIRDVHEAGGLVIVQDVESAQFDGMPRTARDSGVAALGPRAPGHAARPARARRPRRRGAAATRDRAGAGNRRRSTPSTEMLQEEFGIDFTHYKPSTVTRRIERRLALAQSPDIEEYVAAPEVGARRARRALSGPAHRRHPLLPRRAGVRGARARGPPGAAAHASRATRRCGCGSRAARRARRPTRSRSCCRS